MPKDLDKFAYTIPEIVKIVGLGRSFIYMEIKSGRLKVRKAGRRSIVLREDARSYLDSLPILKLNSSSNEEDNDVR